MMSESRAGTGVNKLASSPCAQEYAASLKCLDDSAYDKTKCQNYFQAYKDCKKLERMLRLEENKKKAWF